MTIEELVGSRLVFGIPGTTITPEIVQHFKDTYAGGLILYRTNFQSPDQLRKLISDLENALGRSLLVTADQEGGRVIMFGEGATIFPSPQAFGVTNNTQLVRRQAEQEGRELRRLGIDVNFAPVLDVLTDAYSPNIGIRSYGKDPDLVARMGAARISALQVEGVSACAKHFPGLGPATLDPHLQLPTIAMTWPEWEKHHSIPFYRAMRTAVHSIMTSHPLYPGLDPTPNTPATFSRKIVYENLRLRIGYKGVIFTDDLEMGAITNWCSIGEATVKAAAAGHDAMLVCHSLKAEKEAFTALVEAYKTNRLPVKEMEDSVQRLESLKARRTERFAPPPATTLRADKETAEAQELVKQIVDLSATVLKQGPSLTPGANTAVIFPTLSELADTIFIEKAQQPESPFIEARLTAMGLTNLVTKLVSIDATAAETQACVAAASQADQTLLFVYDAHIHAGTRTLLDQVQQSAKRLVVVLLRDAYDVEWVKDQTLCVTNYGFRVCDIEAVLRKILTPTPVA